MATRREVLGGLAGGIAAGALPWSPSALAGDKILPLTSLGAKAFHSFEMKLFANTARFSVPTYRFGVVVHSGVGASSGSGNASMDASASLAGVSPDDLAAIAQACVQDFIAQIQATGRIFVANEVLDKTAGWAKLETTAQPFVKKPLADARTIALVAPRGWNLFNMSSDAPLTDKGAFAQGNNKAMVQISAETDSLVIIPSVVLDFAALSGSGHRVYGGGASVGIQPGLLLCNLLTQLTFIHAKDPRFGRLGKMILEDRVAVGQAGQLVQTASHNNRDEVALWNSSGRFDPNAGPGSGPSRSYDYSAYQYRVDPQLFAQVCLDGAAAVHRVYAEPARTHRPA
jgi:hypothetical protein